MSKKDKAEAFLKRVTAAAVREWAFENKRIEMSAGDAHVIARFVAYEARRELTLKEPTEAP